MPCVICCPESACDVNAARWTYKLCRRDIFVLQCEANGAGLVVKVFKHDLVAEKGQSLDAQQLVSCLTVTRNRLALVKRAVRCFQAQSYSQRELLVLDDGEDETGPFIASLGEPLIRHVRPERVGMKLGELRNLAIRLAGGKYVMQWDDDDWYHPNRIKVQLAALEYTNSQFCLLSRWTLAWPAKGLFCHSKELCWEGSLLGLKEAMPQYPDLVRGEDSVLVGALLHGTARMCFVDNPELYIYTVHGSNTYPTEHFEKSIFDRHTGALSEAEVRRVLEKLAF